MCQIYCKMINEIENDHDIIKYIYIIIKFYIKNSFFRLKSVFLVHIHK